MEEMYGKLNGLYIEPKEITANRMSIINGREDFTEYSNELIEYARDITKHYGANDYISKIVLAEVFYQKNESYQALIMINSALAFLEQSGHEELWAAARYVQMCIMIVTGQLQAIYPLVNGMQERVYASGNRGLIDNYEALRAWCALYDDDWDTIDSWMKYSAKNEFDRINLEDSFGLLVKARIYYMQSKYLSVVTLLQSLMGLLERNNRSMELCETYMLLAISLDAEKHHSEAYGYLEKCIEIASERDFKRLLADEGEPMYRLISGYRKAHKGSLSYEKFLAEIEKLAKKMALMYPKYLKNHKQDFPELTQREIEILTLIVDERSNAQIAEFFGSSLNTVKYHIKNIYAKLGVNSRSEAAKIAVEENIIR